MKFCVFLTTAGEPSVIGRCLYYGVHKERLDCIFVEGVEKLVVEEECSDEVTRAITP